MKPPTSEPIDVLAILLDEDDWAQLGDEPGEWRLRFARDYDEAETILQRGAVEVIVSDYWIGGHHSWRDLLGDKSTAIPPALVIVVDRHADEGMWVEVLAEGAFDLLRKPLDRAEVGRVLNVACRRLRQPVTTPGRRTAAA